MAVIAAILQAQFRSMRFFGRGSLFTTIAGLIWYGIWVVIATSVAYWASIADRGTLEFGLTWGALGALLYWQFIPLLSASMGASLDLRKLLAYPVPHGKLFAIEVLLRVTNGLEMVLLLTGATIGLMANRALAGPVAHAKTIAAMLMFLLFNLLLSSGLRSVLERLLHRRHVREAAAFLMTMVWVAPRFIMRGGRPKWVGPAASAAAGIGLPWSAAAHAVLPGWSAAAWLSLLGWTAAALWFGRLQFERSLRYDPSAAQAAGSPEKRSGSGLAERFYRLPSIFFRDPMAGLVEKELRSLARTPRFRMVFVMGFTFGLVLWFPVAMGRRASVSSYFLTIVSVYALTLIGQVTYWNSFGFDRSAVAFYYASPQPMRRVLLAKNAASLIYIYFEVLVLSGITVALRMGVGGGQVAETLAVIGICSLYMFALGNVSSVHYPRPLNPERVSQGGGSGFQGLLFLLYPLALLPVALAYLARYAFHSEIAFAGMLAGSASIGGLMYKYALDSATERAASHREQVIQELSRGDGPVVSG